MLNIDTRTADRDEDGIWTDYEGSKLRIAHVNNARFQAKFTKLQLPHKRKIDKGQLDNDTMTEIMCKAMGGNMLTGWKDVVDSSGADVPFSAELAFKVLVNNAELREFVHDFATDVSNFREEVVSEAGNSSSATSSGSSIGVVKSVEPSRS